MRKIAIVSHCVLNHFCEVPDAETRKLAVQISKLLLDKNMGLVQLPCPEMCFQGLVRDSIEKGDSKEKQYREFCKELLQPIVKNLQDYVNMETEITGIIGIGSSPSCSIEDKSAIMMDMLKSEMVRLGITAKNEIDMPSKEPCDYKAVLNSIKQW